MTDAVTVLTPHVRVEKVNTGLEPEARKRVAKQLSQVLNETYALMVKSHVYHWNVVGPLFHPIHQLTEEHYTDLFEAADVIAERIRALGHRAPVPLANGLPSDDGNEAESNTSALEMVNNLIESHENLCRLMRETASHAADADDLVTEDMLVARLTVHEQAIWMLRAIVSE